MSTHVLLILLNELGKKRCEACRHLSLFRNKYYKFNNTRLRHIHFNFIKTTPKPHLSLKKSNFAFLTQKLSSKGHLFQNTAKL